MSMKPWAFALVASYLEAEGYDKTLALLRHEAEDFLSEQQEAVEKAPKTPLTDILEEYQVSCLGRSVQSLAVASQDSLIFQTKYAKPLQVDTQEPYVEGHNVISLATTSLPQNETQAVTWLAASLSNKDIRIYDLSKETALKTLRPHNAPALTLDFHPTSPNVLLSGSMDGTIALTNVETGETIQQFKDHTKYIVQAKFSLDGQNIATASRDGFVKAYHRTTTEDEWQLAKTFGPFGDAVECLAFLDATTIIIGARGDNYLYYIDIVSGKIEKYNLNANGDNWISFMPMHISVNPWDPNYILISTDQASGRLILMRSRSMEQVRNYYGTPQNAFGQPRHLWLPGGNLFVTIGDDFTCRIWSTASGECYGYLKGHEGIVRALIWCPDANQKDDEDTPYIDQGCVITAGFDHCIRRWRLKPVE
ncbi:hypothetical protein BZG36_03181 [Bifiguratus adelaidae]|uniref:Uncharacterized protein n=1 Tax=Bifiguratus adelaidae TaxID=1938954 RepID=A0A261XYQ0_9FUNG|nr:hypothetical protein BZG36_03181 [Bifiguratus adelaidae]